MLGYWLASRPPSTARRACSANSRLEGFLNISTGDTLSKKMNSKLNWYLLWREINISFFPWRPLKDIRLSIVIGEVKKLLLYFRLELQNHRDLLTLPVLLFFFPNFFSNSLRVIFIYPFICEFNFLFLGNLLKLFHGLICSFIF